MRAACRLLLLWSSLLVASTLAQDGVTDDKVLRWTFQMGLFQDDITILQGPGPAEQDIVGAMCQTEAFFSELVQNATANPEVQATISRVSWNFDSSAARPLEMNFSVALAPDFALSITNLTVNEQVLVDQMSTLGDDGLVSFVVDRLWKSPPMGSNFFVHVNELIFQGNVVEMPTTFMLEDLGDCAALLAEAAAATPAVPTEPASIVTDPPTETNGETEWNELWVQFRFGFFDDAEAVQVLDQEDVEGVLCQSQNYFEQLVQTATGAPQMDATISDISWRYVPGDPLPGQFLFRVDLQVDENTNAAEMVSLRSILVDTLAELDDTEIQTFLQEWIWRAPPTIDNYFANANSVEYGVNAESPFAGAPMMEKLTCPELMGNPTLAPGTLPLGGTNETDDQQELRIDFHFGFYNDTVGIPIPVDVESALCKVEEFFAVLLQNTSGIANVDIQSKNIDWVTFADENNVPAINVSLTAQLSGGDSPGIVDALPLEQLLLNALNGCDDQCLFTFVTEWIWKAEPLEQNFFWNTNELNFDSYFQDPIPDDEQTLPAAIERLTCPGDPIPEEDPFATSDGSPTDVPTESGSTAEGQAEVSRDISSAMAISTTPGALASVILGALYAALF